MQGGGDRVCCDFFPADLPLTDVCTIQVLHACGRYMKRKGKRSGRGRDGERQEEWRGLGKAERDEEMKSGNWKAREELQFSFVARLPSKMDRFDSCIPN